ncbi:MAG TPA: DedA family protein [Pedobacter sp.]
MEIIQSLIDFILHIDKHLVEIVSEYRTWTYLILFMIIFAETGFVVTPFLPGDSLLFAAGALIATGDTGLNIYLMTLLLMIAAILGNTINYEMGRAIGVRIFKEHNKILKLSYYVQTQEFFNKHGAKAVVFSRYVPIIRTLAPFVAGVGKMNRARFAAYNIAGGASWIIIFLFAGFLLGNAPFFKDNFSFIILLITIFSILPILYGLITKKSKKH